MVKLTDGIVIRWHHRRMNTDRLTTFHRNMRERAMPSLSTNAVDKVIHNT